eukprot:TRINITY_DN43698_c0_g1_i1.p1 TRINITY_DN43698_c0_g1~~TRINITY_DN43698_c0_g1_i1.p1  ORF type:complete len:866 (-),score=147.18 TRINITY_DN43698_c0_g1_i1:342-2873(-)
MAVDVNFDFSTSGLSSADVVDAVSLLFSASGTNCKSAAAEHLARAEAICEAARSQGFRLYVKVLAETKVLEVRFWCFSRLLDLVAGREGNVIDDEGSFALRAAVRTYARQASVAAERNKVAALYIALVRRDFPARWPDAFAELLACEFDDDFAERVLLFLVEECAADTSSASVFRALTQGVDLPRLCDWVSRGHAESGRIGILAGMAAFLPRGLLEAFPFPIAVKKYDVAVTLLTHAGELDSPAEQAVLRLHLLSSWPCIHWLNNYVANDREKAAELCCTVGETLWSIVAEESVDLRFREKSWEALNQLLPICVGHFCVPSRDFRIADSMEEFFSAVFEERVVGAPENEIRFLLQNVLEACFHHYTTPAWLEDMDSDDDDYIAFFEFKSDIKQMLKKMHRHDQLGFEDYLHRRLLSNELQADAESMQGAVCILCQIVGSQGLERWKDVVDTLITTAWPPLRSYQLVILDVLHKFSVIVDKQHLHLCLEMLVRAICAGSFVNRACSVLELLAETHMAEMLPLMSQMQEQLVPLLRPQTTVDADIWQSLSRFFGRCCAALEKGLRQSNIRFILKSLLCEHSQIPPTEPPPQLDGHNGRSVGDALWKLAGFLEGLGGDAEPEMAEWVEVLAAIRLALVSRNMCSGHREIECEVASALASFSLSSAALPHKLLLPFFGELWSIMIASEIHLVVATKLIRAFHEEATEFAGVVIPVSVRAFGDLGSLQEHQWTQLVDCLHDVARWCPQSVAWSDAALTNVLVGAFTSSETSPRHLEQAARAWLQLFSAGKRPPKELLGCLDWGVRRLTGVDTLATIGSQKKALGAISECIRAVSQIEASCAPCETVST